MKILNLEPVQFSGLWGKFYSIPMVRKYYIMSKFIFALGLPGPNYKTDGSTFAVPRFLIIFVSLWRKIFLSVYSVVASDRSLFFPDQAAGQRLDRSQSSLKTAFISNENKFDRRPYILKKGI